MFVVLFGWMWGFGRVVGWWLGFMSNILVVVWFVSGVWSWL